jgi:probable F420-dependent oxidoreductase
MSEPGVGLAFPNQLAESPAVLGARLAEIEDWGYDSLWVTDHVVGTRSMRGVYEPHWLEALTTLAWMAARTSRLRLGTGILVLPHRDPVLLAKMLVTIDVLSGGRLDVGVGVGWSRVEFRALGVERLFEPRGRAGDECLQVLLRCWAGGEIDFDGEFYRFRHVEFEPRPVQAPHPPIWVGGQSPAALRRTARYGDAWHPHDIEPAELAALAERLDAEAGRRVPRTVRLDVSGREPAALPDLVAEYGAVGCERVVLEFRSRPMGEMLLLAERGAKALFR